MSIINLSLYSQLPRRTESKKIYIIRHGQTEFNKLGMVQGSGIDANLNALGLRQADAFYHAYRHVSFDKVYTSTLKRTQQTVQPFIDKGIAWERLEGLNEISWGNKEGKKLTPEDDEQHYRMMDGWKNGELHLKSPGGESPIDVAQRQIIALQKIFQNESEKNILICMHGRAMRILLCLLTDTNMRHMNQFEHDNLSLYVLHYENHQFYIEVHNERSHLSYLDPMRHNHFAEHHSFVL